MSPRSFSLKPFPPAAALPNLTISGCIVRQSNMLSVSYELTGQLADIAIPPPLGLPLRMDGLWEETCFEFFLGPKDSDGYWEFNLSPAGHWNVYHFISYRSGMCQEEAFTSLPFLVKMKPSDLSVSLELALERIIPQKQALQVAVSAVIKQRDGAVSYWALEHPSPRADFHRRDCFILEL